MTHPKKQIIRSAAIVVTTIGLSASATYASFTSNQVTVPDSRLTTGQAAIKICEVSANNNWGNSIEPSTNLSQLIPDEERELFANREIYIGNDNGQLATSLDQEKCSGYSEAANLSTTPLRLMPTVSFATENCPESLPTHIRLRFELDGIDTGYRTLNSWLTNTTQYGAVVLPGFNVGVKTFAQLSSSATTQDLSCLFGIQFNGKQASS